MFTASEWPTKTGTRTQVATTLILGSRIFLVSTTIFHSSLVKPSSMNTSICGITLKAMRLGNFFARDLVQREDRLGLREQLVHRLLAGARDRLIGRDHDARDLGLVVQRLERDHELRGRAVRIGDDALLAEARDRVGVDLGHDQRNVGVVAPARGVIDHDRAGGRDLRRPFLRHRASPPTSGRCRRRRSRSARAPCTLSVLSPKLTSVPRLRREASATTSSAGNARSARIFSISRPTLPVAPTTATL